LLYRINTIQIELPPLRERGDDILILAEFFLKKYASKYEKYGLKINGTAKEKLLRYHWPGNIRELQHTIEKAVILSDSSVSGSEIYPSCRTTAGNLGQRAWKYPVAYQSRFFHFQTEGFDPAFGSGY
jgi:transcriptional regulator with PAS, ATPase and Fis domain